MRAVMIFSALIIAMAVNPDYVKEDQVDFVANCLIFLLVFDLAEFLKKILS